MRVAAFCIELKCVAVCVAVCCSNLQCAAATCSVVQQSPWCVHYNRIHNERGFFFVCVCVYVCVCVRERDRE